MKFKTVCRSIGIVIVIYFVHKGWAGIHRDRPSKNTDANSNYDDAKGTVNIVKHTPKSENGCSVELNDVKVSASEKMSERHGEAEKIVKDSVENIFGCAEVGETKNEAVKKKMFEDIDNI